MALKAQKKQRSLKFLQQQLCSQGTLRIGSNSLHNERPEELKISDSTGCAYPVPKFTPAATQPTAGAHTCEENQ